MKFVTKELKAVPASGIREMYNLARGMEDLVHLEIGDPDFPTPGHIIEAAKQALDDGFTHYTPNAGFEDLREQLAQKLWNENHIEVDAGSEILVTAGSMQALSLVLFSTINPGEEVLIPDPGYANYEAQVQLARGTPVSIPLHEENEFRLIPEDVEQLITKRTKMLVLNSPANPTGAVMTKKDLEQLAELAKRHDLLVLSDEAYEKLVYGRIHHYSIASIEEMKKRTISIFSFSKTYSMTGWRIGYLAAEKEVVRLLTKAQEHHVACAPAVSQRAALAALEGSQISVKKMVEEYQRRRDFLCQQLNQMEHVRCLEPNGTFYAFLNTSETGLKSKELAQRILHEAKVVTVPGAAFGKYGDEHIRLSFATSLAQLAIASERLHEYFTKL